MKISEPKNLQNAWRRVLRNGKWIDTSDREALLSLIIAILESDNDFSRSIKEAAKVKLYDTIQGSETGRFSEEDLNLPLA